MDQGLGSSGFWGSRLGCWGFEGCAKDDWVQKNGHKTVLSLLGSSLAAGNEAMMKVCVR